MKFLTFSVLLLFFGLNMTSCTSEYQERLEEAKELKEQMTLIEESNFSSPDQHLVSEIREIEQQIFFLAKLSGNEDTFLMEIFGELQ